MQAHVCGIRFSGIWVIGCRCSEGIYYSRTGRNNMKVLINLDP